jgi:hypothetical protein
MLKNKDPEINIIVNEELIFYNKELKERVITRK